MKTSRKTIWKYLMNIWNFSIIFYCSKKEINKFPLLSLEWDYPAHISNIIIDIDSGSNHNYEKIIKQDLALLNCRYIQFRRFDESTIIEWEAIMQIINQSPVRAVDILIKDSSKNFTFSQLSDFVRKNRKIRSVTIHSATENKVLQEQIAGFSVVVAIQQKIDATNHCGVINPSYFITNIETFTESQKHNTCLNRKISVDRNGNIKNCPSMVESFGNIKDTTLEEALNKTTFKKYWNINKDQITVCKDCEFRHICTDCRAYIEDPEDQYSKPLKCGYNPYTNVWEEWSTNPLKEKAITHYNMQELVKK
jgi:SPASM domain peptide maturase of grasp-with-spasm system